MIISPNTVRIWGCCLTTILSYPPLKKLGDYLWIIKGCIALGWRVIFHTSHLAFRCFGYQKKGKQILLDLSKSGWKLKLRSYNFVKSLRWEAKAYTFTINWRSDNLTLMTLLHPKQQCSLPSSVSVGKFSWTEWALFYYQPPTHATHTLPPGVNKRCSLELTIYGWWMVWISADAQPSYRHKVSDFLLVFIYFAGNSQSQLLLPK